MAKYCRYCGAENKEETKFCGSCGANLDENTQTYNYNTDSRKSKLAAGLLGIFLGYLGIHNFYLGYTNKAVTQLLLTVIGWVACGIGPIVASIWGLVDGIMILSGNINCDANGMSLKD